MSNYFAVLSNIKLFVGKLADGEVLLWIKSARKVRSFKEFISLMFPFELLYRLPHRTLPRGYLGGPGCFPDKYKYGIGF